MSDLRTGVWVFGAFSTFEVQVPGAVRVLRHGARVDLQRVHVIGVSGNHHVVPLIVIERLLGVSLHERRPVPEVKHVVDVPEHTGRHIPD